MDLSLLSLYIVAIFLLIITPGPVVALVTDSACRDGTRRALLTVLGTNGASLLLIAAAALIIAGVFQLSTLLLHLLSLAGSLLLGWIALQSLAELRRPGAPDHAAAPQPSGFLRGFMVGIANPKDILFFVAFFPQFIAITPSFSTSMTLLALIWLVMDLLILLTYIWLMRHAFFTARQRTVRLLAALFLLLVAVMGLVYSCGKLLMGW
ncbi:LysE family translocator [Erwinia sp. V71]|uniref:LysE family translocator n=1 Tax=Erwinia sp. V71 TaxID=3369424 RepID=UPI003F614095